MNKMRSEYGSIVVQSQETEPLGERGIMHQDTERLQNHNLPNITSPGRLMIGPKVSTNEVNLGP